MIRLSIKRFDVNLNLLFRSCQYGSKLLHSRSGLGYCTSIDYWRLAKIKDLFMKDPKNLVDNENKVAFIKENQAEIRFIENDIERTIKKQLISPNLSAMSKYLNIISTNEILKANFLKMVLEKMDTMNLALMIEIMWYYCLLENDKGKLEAFTKLKNALEEKMPKDFSKKYTFRHKIMMTQILFNISLLSPIQPSSSNLFEILQNIEYIVLDEFQLDFYQETARRLEENGVNVVNLSNFVEIYNTGIEVQDQRLLDFYPPVFKDEESKIYKMIRYNNLKSLKYTILPVFVQKKVVDNALIKQIIAKIQNK